MFDPGLEFDQLQLQFEQFFIVFFPIDTFGFLIITHKFSWL
jgi:hypothetical protein